MSKNRILNYIYERLEKGKLHFSLIDPEKITNLEDISKLVKKLENFGTDIILVGGSIGYTQKEIDETILEIKRNVSIPVVIFPGDLFSVSKHADAILFLSLLNSRNPYYIIEAQAKGALMIKKYNLEAIPTGYIIVEPGKTVGFIGDAKLIPRDKPEIAAMYALASQYMGMKLVYLEAGSGAEEPIPGRFVKYVKNLIDIPIIVGGGIKNKKHVEDIIKSGADIIVTGTIIERDRNLNKLEEIIKTVKSYEPVH